MQLSDEEHKTFCDICEFVETNEVSNEFFVQLIEVAGAYLNLKTIPQYAKDNNISYNGAKNFRNKVVIFGVKFIIDND